MPIHAVVQSCLQRCDGRMVKKKMWKPLYSCVVILMVSLHSILLNGVDSSVRHVSTAVGYMRYIAIFL